MKTESTLKVPRKICLIFKAAVILPVVRVRSKSIPLKENDTVNSVKSIRFTFDHIITQSLKCRPITLTRDLKLHENIKRSKIIEGK